VGAKGTVSGLQMLIQECTIQFEPSDVVLEIKREKNYKRNRNKWNEAYDRLEGEKKQERVIYQKERERHEVDRSWRKRLNHGRWLCAENIRRTRSIIRWIWKWERMACVPNLARMLIPLPRGLKDK
jgi:hypothetical protein